MALQIFLMNTEIPIGHVTKLPKSDAKIQFKGGQFIASQLEVVLDNNDPTFYDDRYAGSLFYGTDFYNAPAVIYEDGLVIWKGRIKKITTDDKQRTVVVTTNNYIKDMADTPCVISSTSDKTPAELIYSIMTNADYLNIDPADINKAFLQDAYNYQDAASAYTRINFTLQDNKNCLSVFNELCRLSNCSLYTIDNLIHLAQWKPWAGQIGHAIKKHHLFPQTYKHWFDDENIFNSYQIAYYNSGAVATVTGSNQTSINRYGARPFLVPDENLDSTDPADYRILYNNGTGAEWAGDLTLQRFSDMRKRFQVVVGDELSFLNLNEQADFDFVPFTREPVRLLERTHDRDKQQITLGGEFLNTPHQYYDRDLEPPATPELITALPGRGKVLLKWTRNLDTDLAGYYMYLTATIGSWFQEICHLGQSPVEVKSPILSGDGFNYVVIRELNPGTSYSFKVSAFDTSYNESQRSNVLSATPWADSGNFYCLKGDPYLAGLSLDITNSEGGTVPDGYTTYADFDDPDPDYSKIITAAWVQTFRHRKGINSMTFNVSADPGDIMILYRESNDGITWSEWVETEVTGNVTLEMGNYKQIQLQVVFYSETWSDTDNFKIMSIQETT